MNYYFQDTIYPIRFNSYFSLNFSVFAGKSPIYTYNNRGGISMKPWKDVTLTDDYLFSQIMKDEDFCKLFLEMLMGIKITKVLYLEAQKEVNLFPQTKGIRMDVYLEGDDEIYNIEMQTVHKTNLVKRMRYYHSAIDVDSLLRGNPYDQLKKSYVIFICAGNRRRTDKSSV